MGFSILLGYLGVSAIGFSLGSVGAGGAILFNPLLIYFFGLTPVLASVYSMLVIGMTCFIGYWQRRYDVDYKIGLIMTSFALPSLLLTRNFILPNIPETLVFFNKNINRDLMLLKFLGIFILLAGTVMFFLNPKKIQHQEKNPIILMFFLMTMMGFLMGILGIGGGFIITPALAIIFHLSMKRAVATSLMIISINLLSGFFFGHVMLEQIRYQDLLSYLFFAIVGMTAGLFFSKIVSEKLAKKILSFVLIGTGLYTLIH